MACRPIANRSRLDFSARKTLQTVDLTRKTCQNKSDNERVKCDWPFEVEEEVHRARHDTKLLIGADSVHYLPRDIVLVKRWKQRRKSALKKNKRAPNTFGRLTRVEPTSHNGLFYHWLAYCTNKNASSSSLKLKVEKNKMIFSLRKSLVVFLLDNIVNYSNRFTLSVFLLNVNMRTVPGPRMYRWLLITSGQMSHD